jgi:hypothetical protein
MADRDAGGNPCNLDVCNGIVTAMDANLLSSHHADPTGTPEERRKMGIYLRRQLPRSALAEWAPQGFCHVSRRLRRIARPDLLIIRFA